MEKMQILITTPGEDYELLDSGEGEKLERYGRYVLVRPDPQALWSKKLPKSDWHKSDASFVRQGEQAHWVKGEELPEEWVIGLAGLRFLIKPTSFKHTGLFPEQVPNWQWIKEKVSTAGRTISVLNLFGYTGGASVAALSAGAEVTHIDGSKTALSWAKRNADLSGVADKKARWLLDDARVFVEREIRRGAKYDAIIMDPPAFGHGAKKEVWKIEEDLIPLLSNCEKLLSDKPLFFLVNGYSAGYSAVAYKNCLSEIVKKFGVKAEVEIGELMIEESNAGRLLPSGIFARVS